MMAVLFSGIPIYPPLDSVMNNKAYASTNMRIEPSELSVEGNETTSIRFSFNAADNGEEEHDTVIMVCTPQSDGGSPIPGSIIKREIYPTKAGNQYIIHEVIWDGTINGQKLPEGRYTICISPADYTGNSVYYGQMASFEMVGTELLKSPTSLQAAASSNGRTVISGTAAAGAVIELEYTTASSTEVKQLGTTTAGTNGVWSHQISLTAGQIAYITAKAKKNGITSSHSEIIRVMKVITPSFPMTWEAVAGYFYKTDSIAESIQIAEQIAVWNGVTDDVCNDLDCSNPISNLSSILLVNPEIEALPTQAELAQFTTDALDARLRIVNPSGTAPIDMARGDFVYTSPYFGLDALMPLSFNLLYLSRNSNEGTSGLGWLHSYEWSLTEEDSKLVLLEPSGSRYEFIPLSNGKYFTPKGTNWSLTQRSGGGHQLETAYGTIYYFNSAGSLESIRDINGNEIQLGYQNSLLKSVTTSGASFQLSYDSDNLLVSVVDHAGRSQQFNYDANGDLVQIIDVDQSATQLQYDNEHHLIAVTNANSSGTLSVTYDEELRVSGLTDYYGETTQMDYSGIVAPVEREQEAQEPADGPVSINPNNGRDIASSNKVLLSGTMHNLANAPEYTIVAGMQPVIAKYIEGQSQVITSAITNYSNSAVDCSSCTISELQSSITASKLNPVVIKTGYLNLEESVTFGSASKPVILIAEGMNTNKDIAVTINGNLIVKNGLNANTNLQLIAKQVSNQYGNIWSNGAIHLNNDSVIDVADTLYTSSLTYNSVLLNVKAKRIVVAGELHINTKVEMNIANEMSLGGLVSNNDLANLTITGGDLFVRNNVSVNNQLNISTGGVFAIGGDMTPNKTPGLAAGVGSGKTILTYPVTNANALMRAVTSTATSSTSASPSLSASLATANITSLKDALGRTTSYTWNDRFLLQSATLPDQTKLKYNYDYGNRLQSLVDGNGVQMAVNYDERGNLQQFVNGQGQSIVYRYGDDNRIANMTDALGHRHQYRYDTAGNMVGTTDALGQSERIIRNAQGAPVSLEDALGATTVITNDSYGYPIKVKDSEGHIQTITRDELHRIITIDDSNGIVQHYGYDTKDRVISHTDALGHIVGYEYDSLGNLLTMTDEAGEQTSYSYNVDRLLSNTNAESITKEYSYDAAGNVIQYVDGNGSQITYQYDSMDRLVEATDSLGSTITYTYDANSNLLTSTDAEGHVTQYSYNNDNQLLTTTEPNGARTTLKYDSLGQLVKETNALGNSTWYEYDAIGQLSSTTDALGSITRYEYDAVGNRTATIQPDGSVWETQYDSRGLELKSIDPLSNATSIERDLLGRMIALTDAEGAITRYSYNELGQNTQVINALGHMTSYTYDELGNVTKIVDALGSETEFNYDAIGRLLSVQNALDDVTSYRYDANGNRIEQTNAAGATTSYQYNETNQLVQRVNPLGEALSYQYNDNGQLLSMTAEDGTTTGYEYDEVGRVIKAIYSDGQQTSYSYDLIGRRLAMTDGSGTTRYTNDALNRLTEVIDARGNNIRYEWDQMNNRTRVIYPDNSSVRYGYDVLGRVTEVRDASSGLTTYSYDANSRMIEKRLPNTGASKYEYDALGQLNRLTHYSTGGEALEQLSYTYNEVGNMLQETRQARGSDEDRSQEGAHELEQSDYVYDALNQLIEVQARNGATTSYQYDEVGNRLTKSSVESSMTTVETYTYDLANKLTSWTNGEQSKNYTYDQRGNLLEVSGVASVTALTSLQDALVLDENNNIESLIEEPEQLIEEAVGDGAVTETIAETVADGAVAETIVETVEGSLEGVADAEGNLEDEIVQDEEKNEATEDAGNIDEDLAESIDSVITSSLLSATSGVLEQYEWSADNRLVRQVNERGDTTTYQYDGDGNRIYMGTLVGSRDGANQHPSSYLEGLRDGWEPQYKQEQRELYFANDVTLPYVEPLMASSANEQWSQRYVYGAQNERISMSYKVSGDASNDWEPTSGVSGANASGAYTSLHYLADVRGSVIGLTNDAGTISARYHYDEFGSMKDSYKLDLNYAGPDNLFGYTGLAYDYASDLSYARARYFDSGVGRFINEDTYEGDNKNPLSLNLYTYVLNNPLRYVDPSGQYCVSVDGNWSHIDYCSDSSNTEYYMSDYLVAYFPYIVNGKMLGYYKDKDTLVRFSNSEITTQTFWQFMSEKDYRKYLLNVPLTDADYMFASVGNPMQPGRLSSSMKSSSSRSSVSNKTKSGCNCFTAGTKIQTDEGEKNIEDIEVGDMVLSKDEETGEQAYKEVTALHRNEKDTTYKLSVGSQIIETTDNHPFWVNGKGWVLAVDLMVGDELVQSNGNRLKIDNKEIVHHDEKVKVYNFTVADFHTYFVSDLGIWVHNIGACDKLPSQGKVSVVDGAPFVDAGKQGKHVPGHPNYVSGKSTWQDGQNGVQLTQQAWLNGTVVKPDGSVKIWDNGTMKIKVHIDSKGNIHGYPVD